MSLASRVARLEAKQGAARRPTVVVYEEADGTWRDAAGERVEPAEVPANARVIVLVVRDDGPQ